MLPEVVQRATDHYLRSVDQLLPGLVTGFYVVGSVALGAYRPRRSDIDFVAVVDRELSGDDLRRLRLQHARSAAYAGVRAVRDRRSPLTGNPNGVYLRRADLTRPVGGVRALAAHVGGRFLVRPEASDVNPVLWKVWADRGIALRGAPPSDLGLRVDPAELVQWNLGNLDGYWNRWASADVRAARRRFRLRPRWSTAWGALGAPRLHRTIATGEIIGKEAAGEHALDVLPSRFHPLIGDALAYWREEPSPLRLSPEARHAQTTDLVLAVIESAHQLP